MRMTGLAVVLALTVMAGSCDSGRSEGTPRGERESVSPSVSTPPTPDIDHVLKTFARDALSIDDKGVVMRPNVRGAFESTLFHEETRIAGRGTLVMPSALTIRYPKVSQLQQARKFLRLFEKHGFGTGLTYDVDDFIRGTVQRSDDLRCRLEPGPQFSWLRCIPTDFFYLVEWDVANAITSLYADETDSMGLPLWEVLYPYAYDSEPPVGAILRVGTQKRHDEFRAYLYRSDSWELVAQADSSLAIGRAFGKFVCAPKNGAAFPPICATDSV